MDIHADNYEYTASEISKTEITGIQTQAWIDYV
jgi:hypothetical protein